MSLLTRNGISYESTGKGDPTFVFVHGACSDKRIWGELIKLVSQRHRCIAIDLSGHGESVKPETGYGTSEWARDIELVLAEDRIRSSVIVGHSFGANVAAEYAGNYQARVCGVVLLDGNLNMSLSESMSDWMLKTLDRPDYTDYIGALSAGENFAPKNPADAEMVADSLAKTPRHVLRGQIESLIKNGQARPQLGVPTLAINSDCNRLSPDDMSFLEDHTVELDFEYIDDVSHFMMLDEPRKIANLILNWSEVNK